MPDRPVPPSLARRRERRDRIILDADAAHRLQAARAALGLPNLPTTKDHE
ncbi:hypothetical protein [Microbacterium esteraromaticum]|nr:hypothetical protein [Microbacterium esteraromaticum]MBN7792513.1 hypothetical protein [Microbacterium esteraromaticum]